MSSRNYIPRNMLVTGGAGFIGSHFIRYLFQIYPDVFIVNLDKLTYAGQLSHLDSGVDFSRYQFVHGDISDADVVTTILRDYTIDTIVHFAAESHVDRSIHAPAAFIQTNVVGTFVLLDAARQYWLSDRRWQSNQCRFHHISTDEVYGTLAVTDPAFTERTAYAPNSPYSASKASSDHLVRAYFHTYQLPITISNCSNNYGPYQHAEKFIPTVIRQCRDHLPIPVYGNGSNIRDWLYVGDHCRGIDAILTSGKVGEVYNIGGLTELDNLSLVNMLCDLFDKRYPEKAPHSNLISFVTDRPGHDWRYAIDIKKIHRELGWMPEVSLLAGLEETLDFFLDQ